MKPVMAQRVMATAVSKKVGRWDGGEGTVGEGISGKGYQLSANGYWLGRERSLQDWQLLARCMDGLLHGRELLASDM